MVSTPAPTTAGGRTAGIAAAIAARLAAAGCVAPDEEAAELAAAAAADPALLDRLVTRRSGGEPLAWVVGGVRFCGEWIAVRPGVYVPRWQSEPLARRAAELLPETGTAADLCTGSGAIARALVSARPSARVVASDLDAGAVACARSNGVEAYEGDLDLPLPSEMHRCCDVVVSVPPYVPTAELAFLPRDVRAHEPALALDGGSDGCLVLRRVVVAAGRLLRRDGTLLVELGGDEAGRLAPVLGAAGLELVAEIEDDEGDLRGIEAVLRQ